MKAARGAVFLKGFHAGDATLISWASGVWMPLIPSVTAPDAVVTSSIRPWLWMVGASASPPLPMASIFSVYLLTGDPAFLEPYVSARAELPPKIAALKRLSRADVQRTARSREIERLANSSMTLISGVVRRAEAGQIDRARAIVASGEGTRVEPLLSSFIRMTAAAFKSR